MKWKESGFRPPLCTYRLNWARRTSWGWWDEWDDTLLQTQDSKFEPWRSEAEHATSRSRRLPTILSFPRGWGRNIFVSFKPPRPGTEPRTLAWKAAVLTTTLGPPPGQYEEANNVTRKRHKPYKPYWNTNLSQLWKDRHEKEKICRKYKGDGNRKLILKNNFLQAEKIFDKSLRSAERNYDRDILENIEKLNVNDPNAFWAHIKRMGSRSRNIPLNFDKDGMTTTDITTVLENWKTEFESLYNQTGQGDWDDQYYENAKSQKDELETNMYNNINYE